MGIGAVRIHVADLFRRLQFMTRQVQQAVEEDREVTLEHNVEDELGQFAYWYNLRTAQLHAALEKARQASDKLSDENREHQVTGTLLEKVWPCRKPCWTAPTW